MGYMGDTPDRLAALERDVARLMHAAGLKPTPRPWLDDEPPLPEESWEAVNPPRAGTVP